MRLQGKELMDREEYGFLKTDVHLGNHIALLTLAGSYAYGTDTEHSDIDLRGIAIERKEEVLGMSTFEQYEDMGTDTVIYGLKKFIVLALKGNPNVLELLGTRDEHILIMNEHGKRIRDNADIFLSKSVIKTFGSYASAQLRRLQNALARDHYPQEEKEKHILNSLKHQMEHFQGNYTSFDHGDIRLYIDSSPKKELETEIFMDIQLDHYSLRDFVGIYSEMNNIVRDYSKLNHRNRKKDAKKLDKHAMHLIRLLISGIEILQGKGIHAYRENDIPMLIDIRNGHYDYKAIFEMVEEYEHKFKEAAQKTNLPEQPDHQKAEQLLMDIYASYYFGKSGS